MTPKLQLELGSENRHHKSGQVNPEGRGERTEEPGNRNDSVLASLEAWLYLLRSIRPPFRIRQILGFA
jgi:hypothetical protein